MKKGIVMILLTVCLICAAIPLDRGPFPKYALGASGAFCMFAEEHHSYAKVIEEVPILVEVEITKHKGDLPMEIYWHGTLYEAKVLTCYKNETEKELDVIDLVQDGNSEMTYEGYTLFQTGDRLLLPLLSCEKNSVLSDTHPECYRIYGTVQTAMQIADSEDGEVCFTYLPTLQDLPATRITTKMWDSVKRVWARKYTVPSEETPVPENPGSALVARDRLDEWIREKLAP